MDAIILTDDYTEWKNSIKNIKSDVVITYVYHTLKENNVNVEPSDVMKWTIDNLNKPTIGFLDFAIKDGVLLGNVESGYEHGELAANMALEILDGKNANKIPMKNSMEELSIGSNEINESLNLIVKSSTDINEASSQMDEMMKNISNAMTTLYNISTDTKNGINEILIGINEIYTGIKNVADEGVQNTEIIEKLEELVYKFKNRININNY